MKKESFIAGYSFVKGIRAIAYTLLILGLLGSSGWGIFKIVTTTMGLVPLTEAYAAATQVIEKQKLILEETKRSCAQQEKDFINGHEQRITDARNALTQAVEAFNRDVAVALEEVKKVSPLSSGYQFAPLQIPNLDTAEACEQYLQTVDQKMKNLDELKQELYKSIFTGLDKLVGSVQEKRQALLAKISEQEQQIARLKQEIQNIYNSYRVRQKVITYIPRKKELMNKAPLYLSHSDDERRINVGRLLPGAVSAVMSNELLDSGQVAEFRGSVARLIAWLPFLRESPDLKKETTKEAVDPNPELTDEDKQRIKTLQERIAQCQEEIARLQNQLRPIDNQLNTLSDVNKSLTASKSDVLSDWSVMNKVDPVRSAAQTLKKEIADFPANLQKMREEHASLIKDMEASIARAIEARENAWSAGCKELGLDLLLMGVCITLGGIAASWILWALILILMDFVVSNLIIAMRAQDIQLLLENRNKN
ncbi:MAG: hypothetical protein IJB33_05715 [Akkermansia sp.]|nr:hypothetical protein [Akkermansia sp.]